MNKFFCYFAIRLSDRNKQRVSGDEMVHTPAHLTGLIFSALRNCSEIRLSNSPMSVDFSLENVRLRGSGVFDLLTKCHFIFSLVWILFDGGKVVTCREVLSYQS